MFAKTQYHVDSCAELSIVAIDLHPTQAIAAAARATIARLLDEDDGLREIDRVELVASGPALGRNRLFAPIHDRPRNLRVELFGEQAGSWRPSEAPVVVQTLKKQLHGYEDWYSRADEFYGASYFGRGGEDESGYANYTEGAIQAQEAFVDAVLQSTPFESSLEFGCASGAMVRALRQRSIEAWGVDYSSHAIGLAEPAIRPFLSVGDVSTLQDLPPVEAVIGQEVFEHITPQQVLEAFTKLHQVSQRWLLITVPYMPEDGLYLIEQFADLPRDGQGNPIQGHLVQASWYWWATVATLAGFEIEPTLSQEIRRRWNENSRWWNLMAFRRCADCSPEQILQRLDRMLRPAFDALRQDLSGKQIGCSRLVQRDGHTVLNCKTGDRPGYAYYGPYLDAGTGTLRAEFSVRLPQDGSLAQSNPDLPALFVEINSSSRVHIAENIPIHRFANQRGEWQDFSFEFHTEDEQGVQVKLYYVGHIDLEIAWPIRLERSDCSNGRPRRWWTVLAGA